MMRWRLALALVLLLGTGSGCGRYGPPQRAEEYRHSGGEDESPEASHRDRSFQRLPGDDEFGNDFDDEDE